ncbi:PREDICTED: integumentary mucin C.1-like [Amphimedon queenslandica]|uniref:P-type domain-containing protein n=1 Tax=Amphimedon queenslandica TaxID=400682 RepID=A0A1X7UBK6_AMPQE|nr:PREDICTED: integumentary mucin C.1-like [Amphimedon queenslandica]|eukprot:XP_011405517.1 PREDICTED: integumentary mucin C.1-like [Amphimedon queenslandica]
MNVGLILCGTLLFCAKVTLAINCDVSEKYDCGFAGINETGCTTRDCCWKPDSSSKDPWCYQTDVSTTGTCRPDLEKTDCGYLGIQEKECIDRKCCWLEKQGDIYCFKKSSAQSACIDVKDKIDCGHVGITEDECTKKDCCYKEKENEPWCFYKSGVTPSKSPSASPSAADIIYNYN